MNFLYPGHCLGHCLGHRRGRLCYFCNLCLGQKSVDCRIDARICHREIDIHDPCRLCICLGLGHGHVHDLDHGGPRRIDRSFVGVVAPDGRVRCLADIRRRICLFVACHGHDLCQTFETCERRRHNNHPVASAVLYHSHNHGLACVPCHDRHRKDVFGYDHDLSMMVVVAHHPRHRHIVSACGKTSQVADRGASKALRRLHNDLSCLGLCHGLCSSASMTRLLVPEVDHDQCLCLVLSYWTWGRLPGLLSVDIYDFCRFVLAHSLPRRPHRMLVVVARVVWVVQEVLPPVMVYLTWTARPHLEVFLGGESCHAVHLRRREWNIVEVTGLAVVYR